MNSTTPDYNSYNIDELEDAYLNIDREAYPDRFELIKSLVESKAPELLKELDDELYNGLDNRFSESLYKEQNNIPKFKFGFKTFFSICAIILVVALLSTKALLPIWLAGVVGIFSVLLPVFIKVTKRRRAYQRFIKEIGEVVPQTDFYNGDILRTLVPWSGNRIFLSARMAKESLYFGVPRHYRKLMLDQIESVELETFFGYPVAKVNLNIQQPLSHDFYIPWSDDFEHIFVGYFDSLKEGELCSD